MPKFNAADFFGQNYEFYGDGGEGVDDRILSMNLTNFKDEANGGEIENGLGFDTTSVIYSGNLDEYAAKIFYAQLLLLMQKQGERKDTDPEQQIYIAPNSPRIVTSGNRKGQLERSYTVSFFSDGNYGDVADIDNI